MISTAAGLAAEGANTAKKLAMKMEKDLKKDGGKALLDDSLAKKAAMEKVSIVCVRVCSYISFVYESLTNCHHINRI